MPKTRSGKSPGKEKTDRKKRKSNVSRTEKHIHTARKQRIQPHLHEEIYLPAPRHRGKYRIPVGIRFLIGYLCFLAALYIVSFAYGITFPTTILLGKLIIGTRALVLNSVLLFIVFFMIFGFWKRKSYAFDLSISFFSFSALNALISLLLFESAEHPMFRKLLLLSFVSLVLMNVLIIWYVLHEKKYFYAVRFRDRQVHVRDKIFMYVVVMFWTIALLLGGTLAMNFYHDTKNIVDDVITDIGGDYYRGILVCDAKEGYEQDVCLLVVATALSDRSRPHAELEAICSEIESDFYRFTCTRSIGAGREGGAGR